MSTTRHAVGIEVVWVLAAALLASSCGSEWSDSVTVQSSGSSTTCVVATGVGTAGTADVSNVDGACSESLYTVGGAIGGLTRAGLVLANGGQIVSVPANATSFTLPPPSAHTNSYAVKVAAQPAGLTCAVSGGSGLMPASNVTSVKVKCLDSAGTVGKATTQLNVKGLMLFLAVVRSARFERL